MAAISPFARAAKQALNDAAGHRLKAIKLLIERVQSDEVLARSVAEVGIDTIMEERRGVQLGERQMDYDDDSRDGILFRFWIRAASYPGGFPAALMRALKDCHTPADYRRALTELAKDKGVNLPEPAQ
ncbi:hypothetical protein [Brucella tritici]|uniref:Uncharacterized protein n=1 Tax=Brucella tritici TaxID=94626 RepID=A0A6L3YVW5_9HYPH|nr:hypothetical protein [Brucella tritici]KAB2689711.1 hypothetical protein F9L08_03360 [Brucella tritici]